ncbi:INO80C isoform 3, partial [Pongo abelii]
MAAQIPIVATTSTPGIVRNSKKRPASPSHNGSSGGGYGASKKKKVSASSFAQTSVLMLLHPLSQLRSILMFQVCLPTTQTPRANCGSAPLKSFPTFGG